MARMFYFSAFVLGVFFAGYFNTYIMLLLMLAAVLLLAVKYRSLLTAKKIAALVICFLVGVAYFLIYNKNLEKYENVKIDDAVCTIKVLSNTVANDNSITFTGEVMTAYGIKAKANVMITGSDLPYVSYYDEISAEGVSINPIEDGYNGYSFNYKEYLKSQRVYLEVYVPSDTSKITKTANPSNINVIFNKMRLYINDTLEKYLDDEPYMLLSGILIGSGEGRTKDFNELMSVTGLSHVVVASGMHFTVVIMMFLYLMKALGVGRRKTALLIITISFLFALFLGMTPSILRAMIMLIMINTADVFERDNSNSYHILAVSATVMIVENPNILHHVGFILSFMSILGILLMSKKFAAKFLWMPKWMRETVALSLSATIFTLPFTVHSFGYISLVFILGNIIILPLLSVMMIFGILIIALSRIDLMIGYYMSEPVNFCLNAIIGLLRLIKSIPFASVIVRIVGREWILVYYGLICFIFNFRRHIVIKAVVIALISILLITDLYIPIADRITNTAELQFINKKDSGKVLLQYEGENVFIDISVKNKYSYLDGLIKAKTRGVIHHYILGEESDLETLNNIRKRNTIRRLYYPEGFWNIYLFRAIISDMNVELIPLKEPYSLNISNMILTIRPKKGYNSITVAEINLENTSVVVFNELDESSKFDYTYTIMADDLYSNLKKVEYMDLSHTINERNDNVITVKINGG